LRRVYSALAVTLISIAGLAAVIAVVLPGQQKTSTSSGSAVSVQSFLLVRTGPMSQFLDVAYSPRNITLERGKTFNLNLTLAFPKTTDEGDTYTNATALVVTFSLSTPNFSLVRVSYVGLTDNITKVVVSADSGVQLQAVIRAPLTGYTGPLTFFLYASRFP